MQLSFVNAGWMHACICPIPLTGGLYPDSFLLKSSSTSPHAHSAPAKATEWMPLPLEAACLLTKPVPHLNVTVPPQPSAHLHYQLLPHQPGPSRGKGLSVLLPSHRAPRVFAEGCADSEQIPCDPPAIQSLPLAWSLQSGGGSGQWFDKCRSVLTVSCSVTLGHLLWGRRECPSPKGETGCMGAEGREIPRTGN